MRSAVEAAIAAGRIPENIDLATALFEELRDRLPPEMVTLVDTNGLVLGDIGDPSPNARSVAVSGGFVVTMNQGLPNFLYRVLRCLATRVKPQDGDAIAFDETARLLFDVFEWAGAAANAFHDIHSAGPQYTITPEQLHFAHSLARQAELFFLAHELGHVSASRYEDSGEWSERDEEHYADLFAVSVIMSGEAALPSDLVYAGIDIGLLVFELLECNTRDQVRFADTHPHVHSRRQAIRDFLETQLNPEDFKRLTRVAEELGSLLESLVEHWRTPEFEVYYQQIAASVVTDLRDALLRCADSAVPDYYLFHEVAFAILDRGCAAAVIEGVVRETRRSLDDALARSHGQASQEAINEFGFAFRQFKLLMSLSRAMPEPVRSTWEAALGLSRGAVRG